MAKILHVCCIILISAAITQIDAQSTSTVSYARYKIYRITPNSYQDVIVLNKLQRQMNIALRGTEFRPGVTFDAIVSPQNQQAFIAQMTKAKIKYSVLIRDVQQKINAEQPKNAQDARMDWTSYHSYDTIYNWARNLSSNCSQVHIDVYGETGQDRDLFAIRITPNNHTKGQVVVEGGSHANEWISIAVATYMVNSIACCKNKTAGHQIFSQYEIIIVPIANPDGYKYSYDVDRLWTKNLSPQGQCNGTNINRNWKYHWNNGSRNSCYVDYPGPGPFSEPESKWLARYIDNHKTNLIGHVSLFGYGDIVLWPFSYGSEPASNEKELKSLAHNVSVAMSKVGITKYRSGNAYEDYISAAGTSLDWAKGTERIRFPLAFELRDTGTDALFLPAREIIPNGKEFLAGFQKMLTDMYKFIK